MSKIDFYQEQYNLVVNEIKEITHHARTKYSWLSYDVSSYTFWHDFKHSTHWKDWMTDTSTVCYINFLYRKLHNLHNKINQERMKGNKFYVEQI